MSSNEQLPADSMQAARLQNTPSVCRYYKYSGTCRYSQKHCRHQHIRQAAPDGSTSLPLVEERHWCLSSRSGSSEDDCQLEVDPWRFSLLSYNILADKYARHYRSYLYDNVPSTYLDWHHRRTAIVAELAHLQPDIICLQEVDRYEDLESELGQLGYAGIYLQRDGGRHDGCATFWRTSLLKPALVRQLRYSRYDLKDNVALLVLFEPLTSQDAQQQTTGGAVQQQQVQPAMQNNLQLQRQEQQEQREQQQHKQDLLSQWLPRGLWRSNSSSASHQQHHKHHLKQPPLHSGSCNNTTAPVYQLPSEVLKQHSRTWAGRVNTFARDAVLKPEQSRRDSRSKGSARSEKHKGRQPVGATAAAADNRSCDDVSAAAAGAVQQEPRVAPDWHKCALLVANTHIIFTPDKGEVKLGQARMLVQEAAQMAEWYLQQKQQQLQQAPTAPGDAASSSSPVDTSPVGCSCGGLATETPHGVATIIAGDFNATPNSPMYTFLSQGCIDLHKVNRRNVSHMSSGGSPFAKGYRGYKRAQRWKSVEEQRRSLEQQRTIYGQQQKEDAAVQAAQTNSGSSSTAQRELVTTVVAGPQTTWHGGPSGAAGMHKCPAPTEAGGSSGYNVIADSRSSSTAPYSSVSPAANRTTADGGADHAACSHDSSTLQRASSSSTDNRKQYRWSDKEVWKAAGMSYDDLLESSADEAVATALAVAAQAVGLKPSTALSGAIVAAPTPHSPTTKIARAAAAFGAHAAAGAGAAAASRAAAAAAESAAPLDAVTSSAAAAAAAAGAVSNGQQPLLLRHGLRLKSCYETVLGCEPDYTSSHSLFMDTCDYVWYTETPLVAPSARLHQPRRSLKAAASTSMQASGTGCDSHDPVTESSRDSSRTATADSCAANDSLGLQDNERSVDDLGSRVLGYELKPVAVLMPLDGMRLTKGLPSRWLGSDHIALVADFELSVKEF